MLSQPRGVLARAVQAVSPRIYPGMQVTAVAIWEVGTVSIVGMRMRQRFLNIGNCFFQAMKKIGEFKVESPSFLLALRRVSESHIYA